MPAPGARSVAKRAGKLTYSTGVPCPHGHVTERYTGSGTCIGCRLARQAADGFHEKHRAASKRSYQKNKTKVLAWCKEYRANNSKKIRGWQDEWRRRNPEKARAWCLNRRARLAGGRISAEEIKAVVLRQKGQCAACHKRAKLDMDHIIPLALGGGSEPSNIQGLCGTCNRSKGAKHPVDFNRSRGLLL